MDKNDFDKVFENIKIQDQEKNLNSLIAEAKNYKAFSEPVIKYIDNLCENIIKSTEEDKVGYLVKSIIELRSYLAGRLIEYKGNIGTINTIINISKKQEATIEEIFKAKEIQKSFDEQIEKKLESGEDPRKRKVAEKPIPEREIRNHGLRKQEENANSNE